MDLERVGKAFREVEEEIEQGNLARARRLCEEVVAQDPGNVEALMYLAAIAVEEEDLDTLLKHGNAILEHEPDNIETLLVMADAYLSDDQMEKAVEMCDRVLAQEPDNPDARFFMAEALHELGFVVEAIELYKMVLEAQAEDVLSLVGMGVCQYDAFRLDDAKVSLEQALKLEDDNADAFFYLGLIAERTKDAAVAKKHFERALELAPEVYPEPLDVSVEDFEAVVEEVLNSLPDKLKNYLANVPISVEEIPSDDDLLAEDPPLSPNLWGLFRGQSIPEQIEDPFTHLPSEIVLYRTNLRRGVRTREELLAEIRITLEHEIAHFLGLDEDEVASLGLA